MVNFKEDEQLKRAESFLCPSDGAGNQTPVSAGKVLGRTGCSGRLLL